MEKPIHIKDIPSEAIIGVLEFLRATDLANVSEVDKTIFRKDRIEQAIRHQMQTIYSTSCTGTPLKDSSRRSSSFDSPKPLGPLGRSLSFDSPSGGIIRGSHASGSPRPPRAVLDSPPPSVGGGPAFAGTPTAILEDSEYQPHILYIREIKCILAALQSPQSITGKGYWIRFVVVDQPTSSTHPLILILSTQPTLVLPHISLPFALSAFHSVPRGLLMRKSTLKHFLCLKW